MAMRLLKALKRSGFWLRERRNRLWVTPALASVVAVLLALAAAWVSRVVPEDTLPDIDRDTVQSLLTIVASSMLAVTTFSLSIMVSAFASAANGATPRATELVMGDEGTRSAIAMFLSAFIYAVVARVALGMGYYGSAGRFVLFLGTMGVLVMLLVTLVNWVKTLSTLGRMSNTLNKIEQAAEKALRTHWRAPLLGAGPAPAPATPTANRCATCMMRSTSAPSAASIRTRASALSCCPRPRSVPCPAPSTTPEPPSTP